MNSAKNPDPFPAKLPWDEFVEERVTIEELRERALSHHFILERSFAVNPSTPVLQITAVTELSEKHAKGLGNLPRTALDSDLFAIGLWFLMPVARRANDADLDATRSYLKDLKRLSRDIEKPLIHVLALMHLSVAEELDEDADWRGSGARFELSAIRHFVWALPGVADRLALKVEAQRKGRRRNFVLDHSVTLASAAFERAGLPVGPRGQSATRPSARLTGAGSRLFIAYFQQLDKHLSETTLALAMLRCRKRTRTFRA